MKSLLNVMAVVMILVGLALEPRIQQFVLCKLELKQNTGTENGSFIVPPVVLTPNERLVYEGKLLGVLSLNGTFNETIQKFAEEHARYQARVKMQGHQLWEQRMPALQRRLPSLVFVEVANESWPRQSAEDAAKEMYKSWRKSTGHWSVVDAHSKYYGYSMVLGKNGVWYACGIVAR